MWCSYSNRNRRRGVDQQARVSAKSESVRRDGARACIDRGDSKCGRGGLGRSVEHRSGDGIREAAWHRMLIRRNLSVDREGLVTSVACTSNPAGGRSVSPVRRATRVTEKAVWQQTRRRIGHTAIGIRRSARESCVEANMIERIGRTFNRDCARDS